MGIVAAKVTIGGVVGVIGFLIYLLMKQKNTDGGGGGGGSNNRKNLSNSEKKELSDNKDKLCDTGSECVKTTDELMNEIVEKSGEMRKTLNDSQNSMTSSQRDVMCNLKKTCEKYPIISNNTKKSLRLLKETPTEQLDEMTEAVNQVEKEIGNLSKFVDDLENQIKTFTELYNYKKDESFQQIKQQIDAGKQLIVDKFETRRNRYQLIKQKFDKDSNYFHRLMSKVRSLSFSPTGQKRIDDLEEKYYESKNKDSNNQARFLDEFDQLVEENYLSKKNLDKLMSRLK